MDWKSFRLTYEEKAREILKQLTLEEKTVLLGGGELRAEVRGSITGKLKLHYNEKPYRAGGMKEKGIPPMLFADGTRGVVCGREKTTCFPVACMRGASFDPNLEQQVGRAMAREALDTGANLFGGICVNLPYHPGWGRAQEVYGEDSFLLGEMGSALVRGIQEEGVIACVKHFAFNSMENSRFKVSVICDKRTEREVFLPHFKKCVDAGAGAIMSAYNSYQGQYCGENAYLLKQVLKGEWDFDGFILCDFIWGIHDTASSANNGLDMEMPVTHFYGKKLIQEVENGQVSESVIDEMALRVLRTLLAHQDFINEKNNKICDYEQNRKLALICAREGITLLKNDNKILPINCSNKRKKIIVLGYLADYKNTGDHSSSQVYSPYVVSLLQGIAEYGANAEIIYYSGESAAHCKRLALEADIVLIVAGNDYRNEGECIANDSGCASVRTEGGDRTKGLGLERRDQMIISVVAEVRQDAVIILMGGSTITVGDWNNKVGAILMVYYPGMEGGRAVAEVLFGKISPGGKLPFVIPKNENDLPKMNWDAEEIQYEYYHGYTLLNKKNKEPLYPFGYGLSYTTFCIENIQVWREEQKLCASAFITNTGKIEGSEVLQMYVGTEGSVVERPEYVLKDFCKVRLDPGEKKEVRLTCPISEMAYYNETKQEFVIEREISYYVYIGTNSGREGLHKIKV